MIPDDLLNKINNETDLVSLVSEYVSLERVGKNYRGLCPFHDDNSPSFYVTPEKNIAKCMSCNQGGRPINFLRLIKNISFVDAAVELGDRLGIEVLKDYKKATDPNEHLYKIMDDATKFYTLNLFNSESGHLVIEYLKRRKISDETIREFQLGYAPNESNVLYQYLSELGYSVSNMIKLGLVNQSSDGSYYDFFKNRLIFPIKDRYNNIVGFSARALSKQDQNKYINSPETPIFKKTDILYNLGDANLEVRKQKRLYIFEGFFDVISAYQEGIKNTCATMGTALTNNHIKQIKELTNNVVLAFDGDQAGIDSVLKHLPNLDNSLKADVVLIPNNLDPDDYIKNYGPEEFFKLIENESQDSYEFRYTYFLNQTDFENANDIQKFEENVKKMLVKAPEAIISLYKTRLAERLNISRDAIVIEKKQERVEKDYVQLPVKERDRLDNKYIVAEIRLLILMIRSSVWSERITEALSIQEYSDVTLSNIRTKIATHYLSNQELLFTNFKEMLNEEELTIFEDKVQKEEYWINQTKMSEQEIKVYLNLLRETPKIRRHNYLKEIMIEKQKAKKDYYKEMEEYVIISKELSKLRGKTNDF